MIHSMILSENISGTNPKFFRKESKKVHEEVIKKIRKKYKKDQEEIKDIKGRNPKDFPICHFSHHKLS